MTEITSTSKKSSEILKLARSQRKNAIAELVTLPLENAIALICETKMSRRGELLALFPDLSKIIPALPDAELCYTLKAVGLGDAGWIVSNATSDQIKSCVDLDAWHDHEPDTSVFGHWVSALSDCDDNALAEILRELDPEVVCLWLRSRISVVLKQDDSDFEPPERSQTLDGQFYFVANAEKDDLQELLDVVRILFQKDYWTYFRLMQAVVWEVDTENQEWALRWRNGRLQDMGFPEFEEALGIYAPIKKNSRDFLPEDREPLTNEWELPVWLPSLTTSQEEDQNLLRVINELPDNRRQEGLLRLVSLANHVAIADKLSLGDSETLPKAMKKAIDVAGKGLDYLSRLHSISQSDIIARAGLVHLFRIGNALSTNVDQVRDEPTDREL